MIPPEQLSPCTRPVAQCTIIKPAPSCSLRKSYWFHNAEISCSFTCMDCVAWHTIITQKAQRGYAGGITHSSIGVCPRLMNQHICVHNDKVYSYGMVLIMCKDLIWKAWSSSHNPLTNTPHSKWHNTLDFKLSQCPECCMPSFGWLPGVWTLYADISEHSVCSIFIGR